MIMISSKCLRTEFNGGLIDLCVLTGVSMREEKLAKKKKTGRQQKGSRYFYELDEIGFITRDKRTVQFLIGS